MFPAGREADAARMAAVETAYQRTIGEFMIMMMASDQDGSSTKTGRDTGDSRTLPAQTKKETASSSIEAELEKLEKAHGLDPENEEIAFKLAWYLDLIGQDERAIELYEYLAARQPVREGVLLNLSVLYEDAGRYDDAEGCLHRLLSVMPNHPRGRMYYRHVEGSLDMIIEEDSDKRLVPRNLLLETAIADFELSVRARNCLSKMNIRTLGDLLKITEPELMSYKNFGETSLHEIREMLTKKGLRLGQAAEEGRQAQQRELLKAAANVPESVLNKPVADLDLSIRAIKALERLGIATIGDLAGRSEADLLNLKNFGQTSLDDIKKKLSALGLSLRHAE